MLLDGPVLLTSPVWVCEDMPSGYIWPNALLFFWGWGLEPHKPSGQRNSCPKYFKFK